MICNHCGERGIKDTVAHTRVCQGTPQEEIATLRASLAAAERRGDGLNDELAEANDMVASMAKALSTSAMELAAAEREVERLKSQGQAMAEIAMQTEARRDAAERARDEAVAALRALVDRLSTVHESAKYEAVWVFWHSHHGSYTGPTYTEELARARAVLEGIKHG